MLQLLYASIVCFFSIQGFAQKLAVTNLRCEYMQKPLGVDIVKPHLSWELQSNQRNVLQTAYRILVADDSLLLKKDIGNTWDSKKIISSTSIQVQYNGTVLQSVKKYFWKIMVWDNKGNASSWSNISMWQMGLLTENSLRIIGKTFLLAPHDLFPFR